MDTKVPVWQTAIDKASSLGLEAYKSKIEEMFPGGIEKSVAGYALKAAMDKAPTYNDGYKRVKFLKKSMGVDLTKAEYKAETLLAIEMFAVYAGANPQNLITLLAAGADPLEKLSNVDTDPYTLLVTSQMHEKDKDKTCFNATMKIICSFISEEKIKQHIMQTVMAHLFPKIRL